MKNEPNENAQKKLSGFARLTAMALSTMPATYKVKRAKPKPTPLKGPGSKWHRRMVAAGLK